VISVITITGIGDHLQPEWLITFTGMRTTDGAGSIGLAGLIASGSAHPRVTWAIAALDRLREIIQPGEAL
jgi:hypothetical protein